MPTWITPATTRKTYPIRRMRRRRPRTRRYKGSRRQYGLIKSPVDTFAQRKWLKMNFTAITGISIDASTLVGTGFRINDINLPTASAQSRPYGYDQWSQFYQKYRVHGARVHVVATIRNADANGILFMGTASRSGAVPTLGEAYNDPNYKHWVFSSEKPITRSRYYSVARVEGKSKELIRTQGGYGADFGSSPTNLARVIVGFSNANLQVGVNIEIDFRTTITYYCELTEPKALPSSTQPPP